MNKKCCRLGPAYTILTFPFAFFAPFALGPSSGRTYEDVRFGLFDKGTVWYKFFEPAGIVIDDTQRLAEHPQETLFVAQSAILAVSTKATQIRRPSLAFKHGTAHTV